MTTFTALTPPTMSPASVRDDAEFAWDKHARLYGFRHGVVIAWEPSSPTPDGGPLRSGRVDGPGMVEQLRSFADKHALALDRPGDLRPVMDVDVPGRVAVVWRMGGVWVSLWTPEPPPPPTAPPLAPEAVQQPGGRLHRWLTNTPKEN